MTSKDEYGFVTYVSSSRYAKRKSDKKPDWVVVAPPDPRRFAIALSGSLSEATGTNPTLTYFNPLLRNPESCSDYVASVRSSGRCLNQPQSVSVVSRENRLHVFARRDPTVVPTISGLMEDKYCNYNNNNPVDPKIKEEKPTKLKFKWDFAKRKSLCGFLLFVAVCFLCVAAALALFFTVGKRSLLVASNSSLVGVVQGEFNIVNETTLSKLDGNNSSFFVDLADRIQQKLDQIFLPAPLLDGIYNRSEVKGIVTSTDLRHPSIRIQFRAYLNRPDPMAAEKLNLVFVANLQSKDQYRLLGNLPVDLNSITFSEAQQFRPNPLPAALANWGSWSAWSECPIPCDANSKQIRKRQCNPLEGSTTTEVNDIVPCMIGADVSTTDTQVQKCPCVRPTHRARIPFNVVRTTKNPRVSLDSNSLGNIVRSCNECRSGEVCVARVDEIIPICRWAPDPDDPTGCGGFCRINTELCIRLGNNTYKCEEDYGCSNSEWRCGNGLCVPQAKRCDGHFNCYDHSDEFDCSCSEDQLRCGNGTSCIAKTKRCDGNIDCWDGSDEKNCTIPCPEGQFTCTSGECIPQTRFCDGFADCKDGTDEPAGCGGSCRSTEGRCKNGRCIQLHAFCDGFNSCGDSSDEENCLGTKTTAESNKFVSNAERITGGLLSQRLVRYSGSQGCHAGKEFACANGDCIPKHCQCNGINDCGDLSDEYRCVYKDV